MFARIHRGAVEVGGSCLELESGGFRLVVDMGLPPSAQANDAVSLPPITGLAGEDASLLGVVLSHAHPDHYGLLSHVSKNVAVYAGAATSRILREAAFFTPAGADLRLAGKLRDR